MARDGPRYLGALAKSSSGALNFLDHIEHRTRFGSVVWVFPSVLFDARSKPSSVRFPQGYHFLTNKNLKEVFRAGIETNHTTWYENHLTTAPRGDLHSLCCEVLTYISTSNRGPSFWAKIWGPRPRLSGLALGLGLKMAHWFNLFGFSFRRP